MNGIMSGIEDRKNYQVGTENPAATPVSAGDRYKEIYDKYAQPTIDPLGKYLIQGSLQGFSENRGGSTLGNLGLAFGGENLNTLFSDMEGQRTGKRDMELAKLGYDIDEEERQKAIARENKLRTEDQKISEINLDKELQNKIDVANIKNTNKDVYSAQLYETQVEKMRDNLVDAAGDRIISKYKGSKADDIARKVTDFVMKAPGNIKSNLVEIDYVDVGKGKQSSFVPDLSNVQQGQIFYDATMGQWKKRVSVGSGKLDFVTLDPYNNYQPIDIDQD